MSGEKIDWRTGDAARAMRDFRPPAGAGLVVLDPPRLGASREMISAVVNWKPRQILYVSCNPTTFARDAELFLESGFVLESVRGLDMFPQTEHVELIASLCAAT
jgi:23S rRNA (uracil1939-C5)-methyltransferase